MKQSILLIILFLQSIFIDSVSAQDAKFTIAAEGGPSYTNFILSHSTQQYYKPVIGVYAGLLIQYNISKYVSLRSGFTYERTGTNFLIKTSSPVIDLIYHFDYASIPVLARVQFGRKVRFYAEVGPYVSILLNRQYLKKDYKKYKDITSEVKNDTLMNTKNIDYGIVGGIGMEIRITNISSITLGIRDFLGIYDTKGQPSLITLFGQDLGFHSKTSNNSTIFHIGFSVDIGKTK